MMDTGGGGVEDFIVRDEYKITTRKHAPRLFSWEVCPEYGGSGVFHLNAIVQAV